VYGAVDRRNAAVGDEHALDSDQWLALELLRLYRRVAAERRGDIAEHLLCALEHLAKSDSVCAAALDQAYLCIGRGTERLDA
jgi:hypothetical protein